LVNEQLEASSYDRQWKEANYSSGVYFYRLVTDDLQKRIK